METTFEEGHYSNGQLEYKHQYLKHNGKQHGEQLKYYKDGELMYILQYLDGKKHGEQIVYYTNGELMYKLQYLNGKYVSEEEWLEYQPKHKTQSLTDMYV